MTKRQTRYSAVYRNYVCCIAGMESGYYDTQICKIVTLKGLIKAIEKFYSEGYRHGRLIIYDMSILSKGQRIPSSGLKVSQTPILTNKPYPEV